MDHLKLTNDKLDVGAINDLVKDKKCGAISLFVGTTRDNFDSKQVVSLEYEAYEAMALKQMKMICKELRAQWTELEHIAIYHRLGSVPVTEESIIIAISSPHRLASLQAVAHAIEQLKERVPIWKKEQYENSESTWKENKECAWRQQSDIANDVNAKRARFEEALLKNVISDDVSDDLIQIKVGQDEIQRRIQSLMNQKRNEINYNNIMDFTTVATNTTADETDTFTCARTNSNIIKQENSHCLVRVRVVKNLTGPLSTESRYKHALNKLKNDAGDVIKTEPNAEDTKPSTITARHAVQAERMRNLEQYLGLTLSDHKTINDKLKAIEDRVLYLESMSPEYRHFWTKQRSNAVKIPTQLLIKTEPNEQKHQRLDYLEAAKPYDLENLDAIIERMEKEQELYEESNAHISTAQDD